MANKTINQLTAVATVTNADEVEVQKSGETTTKKATVAQLTTVEATARAAQDDVIEASAGLNTNGSYPAMTQSWYLRAADFVTGLTDRAGAAANVVQNLWNALRMLDAKLYIVENLKKFGGVADYSEFEADGTLTMVGDAKVWDDLRVQILTRTGGTAPAYTSGFAGNAALYTFQFAHNAVNNVYFEVQMPHDWDGGDIEPHVHFSPTTTGTGTVRFILEYCWVNINGQFDATAATHGTYNMDYVIASNKQWQHLLADGAAALTPGASQDGISTMMICRLYRDGGTAPDTYGALAALLAFDIHYQKDTLGSREELSK